MGELWGAARIALSLAGVALAGSCTALTGALVGDAQAATATWAPRETVTTTDCSVFGSLTTVVKRRADRVTTRFRLDDAGPFLDYGIELQWSFSEGRHATSAHRLGIGTTDAFGHLDVIGFRAPRRAWVSYETRAVNDVNSCIRHAVLRPR